MNLFERTGRPPVVVCIHGYCQSSAYWAPTVERIALHGGHGLAVDLPGFAGSAGLTGPYTMEAFADAVAMLLDERGIARAIVVGGSMGGVVAQHFALRHTARLERLVLAATGAYTADPAQALARADQVAAARWDQDAVRPIVKGFFHTQPPPERVAEYVRIALAASQQAAVEAARSNARNNVLERLGEITVPTLIIQGRHDTVRTVAHGEEMRARMGDARLEVLEGSGHTPQLEEPDAFHRLALPFLLAGRGDGPRS
jgi:pimeloyl-ACP methyl ester carboxylesterase